MKTTPIKFKTVDEYIATFPPSTRKLLQQVRKTIKQTVPEAEEVISYNMPAAKLNGVLVYYAAYEKHIGFYPTASGIENFKNELGNYTFSKGAVQFPVDKTMPVDLIKRIVQFRAKETAQKAKSKK